MKCLSFNSRGSAIPDKKVALKRLCHSECFDVIFLQETLGEGSSLNNVLLKIVLDWAFHFLDVKGRLGGCALGYNKRSIRLENVWGGEGYLGVDIISTYINTPFKFINVYGPCHNRELFFGKTPRR